MKIRVIVEYEEAEKALAVFLPTNVIFQLNHLIKKKKIYIWTEDSKSVLFLYNSRFCSVSTEHVTCIFRFL